MSSLSLQKSFAGSRLNTTSATSRGRLNLQICCSKKKTDLNKVGLNSVQDPIVKKNLMGYSDTMKKAGWVDPQGRKGKGLGVYQFADKYGANVDGYSPIYAPDNWSSGGDEYRLGTKGLVAWLGLLVVLLAVGANLVISTSQLGA